MNNSDLAKYFNVSVTTVKNYADLLGLRKDPTYLGAIRSNASRKGVQARWKK